MRCWICGAEATSGEHMVKASDLRSLFGKITNQKPLFLHSSEVRNRPVAGIRSDKFKHAKVMCIRCNGELTQPYDRAWEELSEYLRSRYYNKSQRIRLHEVFPGNIHKSMLRVHLFFVKLFGCLIVENKIPIDIREFSNSVRRGTAHPKVHIAFWATLGQPHYHIAGRSIVDVFKYESPPALKGIPAFATWTYYVDNIAVNVMYAEPAISHPWLSHSWHPNNVGKRVLMKCGLNYNFKSKQKGSTCSPEIVLRRV